jgi:hypothetical protein
MFLADPEVVQSLSQFVSATVVSPVSHLADRIRLDSVFAGSATLDLGFSDKA